MSAENVRIGTHGKGTEQNGGEEHECGDEAGDEGVYTS